MKIVNFEAYLYAPGILQILDGINPIIVTGFFHKRLFFSFEKKFWRGKKITHKGIELSICSIRKNSKNTEITCEGQLPSVSVRFFKSLKKDGWIIDPKTAWLCGFPSDKQDQLLKQRLREQEEGDRRLAKAQKRMARVARKANKDIKKPSKKINMVRDLKFLNP